MKHQGAPIFAIMLSVLVVFIFARDVCAYIDPGTGSYLLQFVIAGVVGSAFAVKIFWKSINAFIGKMLSKNKGAADDGE